MGYISINGVGPVYADEIAYLDAPPGQVRIHYVNGNSLILSCQLSHENSDLEAIKKAIELYQSDKEGPMITARNQDIVGSQLVIDLNAGPENQFALPTRRVENTGLLVTEESAPQLTP